MNVFDSIEPGLERFNAVRNVSVPVRLDEFIDASFLKYCEIARKKSYLKNVEWRVRHHLASKKIALSAVFYTQAKYMLKHNMKNLSFYASYYSYFNALSSNLILLPYLEIRSVRNISHGGLASKIENFFVRRGVFSPRTLELLGDLRFARELYSYHLPLSGRSPSDKNRYLDAEDLYRRLTDLLPSALQTTNMLSYLSYAAFERKGSGTPDEYDEFQTQVDTLFHSVVGHDDAGGKRTHYDDGDYYQLGSYLTKFKQPMPIGWLIHDWTLEELESAWNESDEEPGYSITSASEYLADTLES